MWQSLECPGRWWSEDRFELSPTRVDPGAFAEPALPLHNVFCKLYLMYGEGI